MQVDLDVCGEHRGLLDAEADADEDVEAPAQHLDRFRLLELLELGGCHLFLPLARAVGGEYLGVREGEVHPRKGGSLPHREGCDGGVGPPTLNCRQIHSDVEVPVHAPRAAPAVAALAVAAALVGGLMLGVLLVAFASTLSAALLL